MSVFKNILLVLVVIASVVGCKKNTAPVSTQTDIDELLSWNKEVKDTAGPILALKQLDSVLAKRHLTTAEQLLIFRRKKNIYYFDIKNYRLAATYADSMVVLLEQPEFAGNHGDLFEAYISKADACYALDRFEDAFIYYGMAKELIPLISSNQSVVGSYYYRIANAYYSEERFEEAVTHFKIALQKFESVENPDFETIFRKQEILSDIGLSFEHASIYDSALHYYNKASELINSDKSAFNGKQLSIDEANSVVFGNIGSVYKKMHLFDSARKYLQSSIYLNKRVNKNLHDRSFNMMKLAELYIDEQQFGNAQVLLHDVDLLDSSLTTQGNYSHDVEICERIAEIKSKYYFHTGDYKKANEYLMAHHMSQEKRWRDAHKLMLNNIEQGIDHYDHERHIALLEKDVQIGKKNAIIYILLVIIAGTISVVIFLTLRTIKVKHQLLKKENQKIVSESAIKEEELKQQNRRNELNYMALIENTEDFFWSVDVNLNFLAFNKAFYNYIYNKLGVHPEIGKPDVIKDYDIQLYNKVLEGYNTALSGKVYHVRLKGLSLDKSKPDLEVTMNPIYDDQGAIVGVSCCRKDITEYVRLINALRGHNVQLQQIAWMQSHKLRGPLSTLMGISMVLSDLEVSSDAKQQLIISAAEKLQEIDNMIREIVEMTNKYNVALKDDEGTVIL